MTVGGILLTGGTSRRLGFDKATLVIDGETLALRGARSLTTHCAAAVEVGPGHTGLAAVTEDPPGGGPLAALVAGAVALPGLDAFVLLACDLPFAEPVVGALVSAPVTPSLVVPVDAAGTGQYVCARYGAELMSTAAALLAVGERSLRALVALVPADRVVELRDLPPDALADVDTPDDVRRWGVERPR